MNESLIQKELTIASADINFKIKNAGFYVNGSFTGLSANIKFDEKNLKESGFEATINAKSINTENTLRDIHLRTSEYFDVEKYPLITMKSNEIMRSVSGNFTANFDVIIKDKTKKILVPFFFENNAFSAKLTLNRRHFGIGGSSFLLSDEVIINLVVSCES